MFTNKALSSSKPKKVWQIIHRILNPSPQPLRCDVENLNEHFVNGAMPVDSKASLMDYIKSLDPPENTPLHKLSSIKQITPQKILKEIKSLRLDTPTGPDLIPAKFLKPVSEFIAGLLTNIINYFIKIMDFPKLRKRARITPIPKVNNPMSNNDYKPISILPVLSKIYERIIFNLKLTEFIESEHLLSSKISGFREVTLRQLYYSP